MLLNSYYKMQFYQVLITNDLGVALQIPTIKLCDGTECSVMYGGTSGNSSNCFIGSRFCFTVPYSGILSQTAIIQYDKYKYDAYSNLIVGNGTTPAAPTDYCLENEITTDISYLSVNKVISTNNGTITFLKTMRNTGGETLTVSEIGLSWSILTGSSTGKQVLVYREVLDTPLVVAAGESFTVSITHSFAIGA